METQTRVNTLFHRIRLLSDSLTPEQQADLAMKDGLGEEYLNHLATARKKLPYPMYKFVLLSLDHSRVCVEARDAIPLKLIEEIRKKLHVFESKKSEK